MANTLSLRLSSLETAVLENVVYSDLFDFPLTSEEVWRWLPRAATLSEVEAVLQDGHLAPSPVASVPPYFTLRGHEHLVEIREQRRRGSAALMTKAQRYGAMIARLPFVRMVAVTGSLAVDNAGEGDDIDYLIVTAPGRVWLTRAMTMLVVRLAARQGITLCPNYVLSEANLALPDHDFYTARELLQMTPIAGYDIYQEMLNRNGWWRDCLPNAVAPSIPYRTAAPSFARRAAEALLATWPFDQLERWLLAHKGRELRSQSTSDETVFDASMCKGHFQGWRDRTRQAVAERMERLTEVAP